VKLPYYVTAGSQLMGGVLAGFLIGVWAGKHFGQPLLPIAGLFAGVLLGGFAAFRLLLRGK
jgi:ABC-type uncharacterized transport system permease subunit